MFSFVKSIVYKIHRIFVAMLLVSKHSLYKKNIIRTATQGYKLRIVANS